MAKVPIDSIRLTPGIPTGNYLVRVDKFERTSTKGGPGAKLPAGSLMYTLEGTIIKSRPTVFVGNKMRRDYMVVATRTDPQAKKNETWASTPGASRVGQILGALKIKLKDDALWPKKINGKVIGVTIFTARNKTTGRMESNVDEYWPKGLRKTGVTDPEFLGKVKSSGESAMKRKAERHADEEDSGESAVSAVKPKADEEE